MAYLTVQAARSMVPTNETRSMMESALRKSAAAPRYAVFDIFLSHASVDAEAIRGVKADIEAYGLSVYVDWIDDPQLDRTKVTPATASILRYRMDNAKAFIFAISRASPGSAWMPWELGYFDGIRRNHVALLPIEAGAGGRFPGQEYLGLYPAFEDVGTLLPGIHRIGIQVKGAILTPRDFINTEVWRNFA